MPALGVGKELHSGKLVQEGGNKVLKLERAQGDRFISGNICSGSSFTPYSGTNGHGGGLSKQAGGAQGASPCKH